MIPKPAKATIDLAMKLATDSLPEMNSKFAMANMGMMSGLFMALGQDSERGIAHRMMDIDDMKAIFQRASSMSDVPHAVEMARYCEQAPASLYMSDVEAFHGQGLELLIALHAWSESHADDLNNAIWGFLRKHTERHKFDLG